MNWGSVHVYAANLNDKPPPLHMMASILAKLLWKNTVRRLAKNVALSSIRAGLVLPDSFVEKIQDFSALKRLISSRRINVVLDVGANRGQFARHLRQIGYAGHIISFEPIPSEYRYLVQSFKADKRWKGLQIALGERSGDALLNLTPESTVMSSMLPFVSPPPNLVQEAVQMRRLDELFAELTGSPRTPRVLLKLDTQGYDTQVFRGAQGCLDQIIGLYAEVAVTQLYQNAPSYLEALGTYEQAGYGLVALSVNSWAPSGTVHEFNCLMSRE